MAVLHQKHKVVVEMGTDPDGKPVILLTMTPHGGTPETFRIYDKDTFVLENVIDIDERCVPDALDQGWEVIEE